MKNNKAVVFRLPKIDYLKLIKWGFLALLITAAVIFIYFPNYTRLKRLKQENILLNENINGLKKEISELNANIRRLDSDSFIWEKLARQNIGIAKDGEIIVDIRKQD